MRGYFVIRTEIAIMSTSIKQRDERLASVKSAFFGYNENWRMEKVGRRLLGEFLATFCLMFLLTTAMALPEPNLSEATLFTAFVIQGIVEMFIDVSGAHFNPIITFSTLIKGVFSFPMSLLYLVTQLVGSVAGTALAYYVTPDSMAGSFAVMRIHPDVGAFRGAIIEFIASGMLVAVVSGVCEPRRTLPFPPGAGGMVISMTVAAIVISFGKYTMACLNPARAFGPAFVMGVWDDHWVYWVGPLLGSGTITLLYKYVLLPQEDEKPTEIPDSATAKYMEAEKAKESFKMESSHVY